MAFRWVLDEHQYRGDDPQCVEDSRKHGELLLQRGGFVGFSCVRCGVGSERQQGFLAGENQEEQDSPGDDADEDRGVKLTLLHVGTVEDEHSQAC